MQMTKTKTALMSIITMFVILAFFCLTACTKNFDLGCQFSQDSLTLSVGEEFNPNEFISSDKALTFSIDRENVLTKNEAGSFVATQSGRAIISAYNESVFVDSMEVYVKYKFLTPTNLKVSNDGVLTWDKSDVLVGAESVPATYELKIKINDYEYIEVFSTNQFSFQQAGRYEVSVRAVGADLADASDYSKTITFNYDLTQGITGLTVQSSEEFGSQVATITWAGAENGVLVVDGVQKNVQGTSQDYDFKYFDEGEQVEIKFITTGEQGESKTYSQTVKKLTTPIISISAGRLAWISEQGAKEYVINLSTQNGEPVSQLRTKELSTVLEGVEEGIYTISYQAVAESGYLNGNVKQNAEMVGKISNVNAECEVRDGKAVITFTTSSEYNKRFTVRQNQYSYTFEFNGQAQDGVYTLTKEFQLFEGENIFTVQAMPTLENGVFEFEGQTTSKVVMSDESTICKIYNLSDITNLQHYTDEEGVSYLEFNTVAFADAYEVKINGFDVQGVQIESYDTTTVLNIGKITKELYGDGQQFNIELTGTREVGEGEQVMPSSTQKLLTMLEAPVMQNLNGTQLQSEQYQWQEVEGASYSYRIYTTDETFEIQNIDPETFTTSENFTQELEAGYYVIEIKSLPIDENNYLASEEYSSDRFYVAQQLESAPLKLDYSSSVAELAQYSGYVLSIQTVEFAFGYTIKVDGSEVGQVYNDSGDNDVLTFNFPKGYDFSENGKQFLIQVEAFAEDSAAQTIHTNSTSSLTVNRLATPTDMIVEENSTIAHVVNSDATATLTIEKDGQILVTSQAGEDALVSLESYDGDFQIRARLNGYQNFEGFATDGQIYLESAFATFAFHRSQTPSQLNYSQEEVSFVHDDKASAYHVDITVSSQNGNITRYFETQSKIFNLEEEIAELRANDAVFNSYFSQKTQITIKVFADISSNEDGVYYLPSRYATLKYDASKTDLVISKLDSVKLSYNEETEIISWQGVSEQNPQYLVYLGDELQQTITAPAQSGLFEFSVADYDFLQPGDYNFYVIVKSDNSLQSDASSSIIFHKISPVNSVMVFRQGQDYYASFEIGATDANYVTDILVNDVSIGGTAQFKLNADSFSITLKGTSFEQDGNEIYFVSSTPTQFNIAQLNISTYQANANIENNLLVWDSFDSFVQNWALATPANNLRYEVVVLNEQGEVQRTITNLTTNSLQLSNSELVNLINGDYKVNIYAYINEYNLFVQGKGYWGIITLADNVSIKKLDSVQNLTASIDDAETTIDEELQKTVNLSWEYNGTSTSQVNFEIYLNNSLVGTTASNTYQIAQNLFTLSQNTIKVVATSLTDIKSDEVTASVLKFETPQISVDDRGILTITAGATPPAQEGFIIEITVKTETGDQTRTYYVKDTEIDIQPFINAQSGAFALRVTQKATQQIALPNQEVALFNGRILAQPQIVQDETGLSFTSTDSDVTFYLRCEEKDFEVQVDGNHFNFPEEWQSGEYTITVHARKEGAVDSWTGESAQKKITITRIDSVSEITFTRSEDYLDHEISWPAIDNASGYQIQVYKGQELVATIGEVTGTSLKLSEILTLDNSGGQYTIKFKTLTDYSSTSLTNSHEFVFTVNVSANAISNIRANETGLLAFDAQSLGAGIYLGIKDAEGKSHEGAPIILDPDVREFLVKDLTGQLQISLRQIYFAQNQQTVNAQNTTVLIDGAVQNASIYKLQDIVSVNAQPQTGKLLLNVAAETGVRKFYVKVVDENGLQTVEQVNFEEISNVNYEMLAIELCERFALKDGETFDFTIYSVIDGMFRSDEIAYQFTYRKSNSTVVQEKISETEDYVVIKDNGTLQVNNNITKIHLRTGEIGNWTYYVVELDQVKGYWITHTYTVNDQEITEESFSLTDITGEGYTSVPCYAINITNLLENMNAGSLHLQVGYITSSADESFIVNAFCQSLNYTKLAGPSNLVIDQGNLSWKNSAGENTGFVISLENQKGVNQIFISASDATYYLGENITVSGEFEVALQAVSSSVGILPSNKLYYEQNGERATVRKLGEIDNELTIANGVMSLDFDDSREIPEQGGDESAEDYIAKLDSLERRLAKSNVGTIWTSANFATRLLNDVLRYPFDYKLEELEDLKFNLKFVNTDTQQKYVTSVSAIQLLSRLDEQTLSSLNSVINSLSENQLASRLRAVYNLLTSPYYFGGVATSSLLFDEIGSDENGLYGKYSANIIPAGNYDVYIQQQGSSDNSTLSSAFALKQRNIKVIDSPQTRAGEVVTEGNVSEYFIKFRPVLNDSGVNYTNYTLVLKDNEKSIGENNIEYYATITYDIVYADGVWTRTAYTSEGKTTQQLTTDEDGYVLISVNSQSGGLIYEQGIEDIYGSPIELEGKNFTANVFVNGNETSLNSKTEEISVVFLQFDINSLKLQSGVFTWNNFSSGNKLYSTTVVYKHYSTNVQEMTVSGQKPSLSFTNTGLYEYITFYTQGTVSNFSIMVDSPTYTIKNVYKLAQPNISVIDGKFSVADANASYTASEFLVSNDVYQKTHTNMFGISTNGQDSITYQTGTNLIMSSQTERYNLGLSERTASKFYFATAGDSFELSETNLDGSDKDGYVVNINLSQGEYSNIYLQSATTSISASKLQMADQKTIFVQDGDIHWQKATELNSLKLPDNLEIVYEVKVEYYHATSSGWEISQQDTKVYFTTNNYLSAEKIVDPTSDPYRYAIYVRAHAYSLSTSGVADVTTLEGDKYVKVNNSQYTNNISYVLEGELYYNGTSEDQLFTRSQSVENFKITDGKISWAYDGEAEFEVYNAEQARNILLDGEIELKDGVYYFTLSKDKQQLNDNQAYNFAIIAKQVDKIDSNISVMFDGFKGRILSVLEQTDFKTDQVSSVDGVTVNSVDFSPYFTRSAISPKTHIALQITVPKNEETETAEKTFILTSSSPKLYIQVGGEIGDSANTIYLSSQSEGVEISVQPIPNPGAGIDYLLSAYKPTTLTFSNVEWSDQDVLYFDEQSQTFYWTYGAKFSDKTLGETILYKDKAGTVYGLDKGQNLSVEQISLQGDNYVPIKYYSGQYNTYYIDVYNTYSKIGGDGILRIYATSKLEMYTLGEDGTYKPSGIFTADGVGYTYGSNNFAVKVKMPFEQEASTYFVPANLIQYKRDAGNNLVFTVLESTALYTDESLSVQVTMEDGVMLNVVNYDASQQYQQVIIGGETVYIPTKNVYHYLEKDETFEEDALNVHFKVSLVTEYQYQDGAYIHTVRVTREYDNVPLGEVQTQFGDFNVSQEGIYVSSFEPNLIGTILEFKVQARKSQNNLLSEPLGLEQGQTAEFNLFDLGDGSASNPYQIANMEQFENISYRYEKKEYHNAYKEKVYETRKSQYSGVSEVIRNDTEFTEITDKESSYNFLQTQNLSTDVNGFVIGEKFIGSYDGGNYSLNVNITNLASLQQPIETRIASSAGSQSISFAQGAAVFKEVGEGSTVKNLNVSFNISFGSTLSGQLSTNSALVGGLALINNGTISNVNVTTSTVVFESAISSAGTLAVAPIIGINNKTVRQLTSQATVNISNAFNRSAQNFMYGGLVAFNNSTNGQILLSKNDGDISVSFTSNQNGFVMAGGIAISNVNAVVEMTINNADVNCASTRGSAYAGGVAVHSYGGSMYHSANTGNITATNAGGIAYSATSMRATGVVGMGKVNNGYNYLFARSATYTSDSGVNYTYSSYNPSGLTFIKITQDTEINCRSGGYVLSIDFTSVEQYSVQIIQKQ